MFLSDDLMSSGITVCSESACSELLSEEPISAVSKHSLDSLPVDSSSVYSLDLLYELNKDRFLTSFVLTYLKYLFLIFSKNTFFF